MSLDRILQALAEEAERQVTAIEQAAQAELERICAQAQARATEVRQTHLAAVQEPLQAERAHIFNQAKLEALQIVLGTREALMLELLQATAQRLAMLPTMAVYAKLLRRLTQEAIETLGESDQLCLRVQSRDVLLMRQIAQEMGLSATVEADAAAGADPSFAATPWGCLGGVIATTSAERIHFINTLEMRLQRVATLYRAQIAGMICDNRLEE